MNLLPKDIKLINNKKLYFEQLENGDVRIIPKDSKIAIIYGFDEKGKYLKETINL